MCSFDRWVGGCVCVSCLSPGLAFSGESLLCRVFLFVSFVFCRFVCLFFFFDSLVPNPFFKPFFRSFVPFFLPFFAGTRVMT
jgi:hypothetical protein